MQENSKFIDGKEAITLNELCSQYDKVKSEYEEIKEKFENMKEQIKAICTDSKNETTKFLVKMRITPDGTMIDTKQIKEKYPEIAEECTTVKKGSRSIQEILKK